MASLCDEDEKKGGSALGARAREGMRKMSEAKMKEEGGGEGRKGRAHLSSVSVSKSELQQAPSTL